MEVDLKIISSILIGLVGILVAFPAMMKAWAEYKNIHRTSLRTEADFSWALYEKLTDSDLRRYAVELSYSAIVWDKRLSHAQRKAILSLQDNARAVTLYLECSLLISILPQAPILSWRTPRHAKAIQRKIYKLGCYLGYFVIAFSGFIPLIGRYYLYPGEPVPILLWVFEAIYAPPFLIWAIKFLARAEQMATAERLMVLAAPELEADLRD